MKNDKRQVMVLLGALVIAAGLMLWPITKAAADYSTYELTYMYAYNQIDRVDLYLDAQDAIYGIRLAIDDEGVIPEATANPDRAPELSFDAAILSCELDYGGNLNIRLNTDGVEAYREAHEEIQVIDTSLTTTLYYDAYQCCFQGKLQVMIHWDAAMAPETEAKNESEIDTETDSEIDTETESEDEKPGMNAPAAGSSKEEITGPSKEEITPPAAGPSDTEAATPGENDFAPETEAPVETAGEAPESETYAQVTETNKPKKRTRGVVVYGLNRKAPQAQGKEEVTQMTESMNTMQSPIGKISLWIIYGLLAVLVLLALIQVIGVIIEYITKHRHMKVCVPVMMEALRENPKQLEACITNSGLLARQKQDLLELTKHPTFSQKTMNALALRVLDEEKDYYLGRIRVTDLISRLGPILGLMGTLIPLGPGLMMLGEEGGVGALSASLTTAFNTTIIGLTCAALAMIVSFIRRKWYGNYLSIMETLIECLLEVNGNGGDI